MGAFGDGERKTKKSKGAAAADEVYGDEFKGWVNLNLTAAEKENFDAWFAGEGFLDGLFYFASDGCHVGVKPSARDGGFLATAVHRRIGSPNYGLGVSARGRTANVALGRLIFSLVILDHENDWQKVQPIADPDRW